ncbi:lactonase family protein [Paenibacillus yanchengensis]|uniref:Lactonase family protein n=1 Tax=Paenibacillus yanchengensis TaxID=2035833 RepID=A0ABW4YLT3_9BACL
MQNMEQNDDAVNSKFYVGSYGEQGEATVHLCEINTSTGEIKKLQAFRGVAQASYLSLNEEKTKLYAVQETAETAGEPGGSAVSLELDTNGQLVSVTSQSLTHGDHPCYIYFWEEQQVAIVANYSGGNVAVLPVDSKGYLMPASAIVKNGDTGTKVNEERQQGAYAHSIIPIPDTTFVAVADLGMDAIIIYQLDGATKQLSRHSVCSLHAGAGPRHIVFHPQLAVAYVINELDSTVSVLQVNKEQGTVTVVQTISALPEGFNAYNDAADIHITKDGRFLYSSNRGHNSIAAFAVDAETGQLTAVQHVPSGGELPRNFAIVPGEKYVLVANMKSGLIVVFTRDEVTGLLTKTDNNLEITSPVCIRF